MRWKWFLGLGALSLGLLTLAMWAVMSAQHHINATGFEKIKIGMTEREVVAILGRPPGDYAGPHTTRTLFSQPSQPGVFSNHWTSDDCDIEVLFKEGRVLSSHHGERFYHERRTTFMDKVAGLFGF